MRLVLRPRIPHRHRVGPFPCLRLQPIQRPLDLAVPLPLHHLLQFFKPPNQRRTHASSGPCFDVSSRALSRASNSSTSIFRRWLSTILATDSPSCALNSPSATASVTAEIPSVKSAALSTTGRRNRAFGSFAKGTNRSIHTRIATGAAFSALCLIF